MYALYERIGCEPFSLGNGEISMGPQLIQGS